MAENYTTWANRIISVISQSDHIPYWYKRMQASEIENGDAYYKVLFESGKDSEQVLQLVVENYYEFNLQYNHEPIPETGK